MNKVVVIEDETIIRNGIINMIRNHINNFRVVGEANNGEEGIKVVESLRPDIILLDINMPIMNGLEMLEHIPRDLMSVIIVSGESEFEYAKQAIRYGVTDYLLKPIEVKVLQRALEKASHDLEMKLKYKTPKSDKFEVFPEYRKTDSITLLKAIDYIENNINKRITMTKLVEVTGKSTTSINARFQRDFGFTFNDYYTRLRMQKAVEKISQLDSHLYEVAECVGFNDYKYFNQVFKKVVGETPKNVQLYYLRKREGTAA